MSISIDALARREFLVGSVAVAAATALPSGLAAAEGKKTFTILHTNDMHSAFIGMGPQADYTPFKLNDDTTRGGFARLAGLISRRREARKAQGPVLVLDAGDYSMGTAFGAATREIGGELRLMAMMGYDATTFGNHEFDLGPDGLGRSIGVASKVGRVPAVLASNTEFAANDPTLAGLQQLAREGVIRGHAVIERDGIRFGLFGVLGKEAMFYTTGGAASFRDAIETAREMVRLLRETEKVDVVICLSHGGVEKGKDGRYSGGDDVRLAKEVPGIDIVIGGHSHTELNEPILVDGRTPVVQTGKEGENLGELVVTLDGGKLAVESYRLYAVDDTVAGDQAAFDEIERLKKAVTGAASRRAATASTSRWRWCRKTCPIPSSTFLPARCWPISSPTPSEAPPRPTSASPPTACCVPVSGRASRACRRSTTCSPWRRSVPAWSIRPPAARW